MLDATLYKKLPKPSQAIVYTPHEFSIIFLWISLKLAGTAFFIDSSSKH